MRLAPKLPQTVHVFPSAQNRNPKLGAKYYGIICEKKNIYFFSESVYRPRKEWRTEAKNGEQWPRVVGHTMGFTNCLYMV